MAQSPSRRPQPEKLTIIGVTGPVGSGCTTLSRFLSDDAYEDQKGLESYLQENCYLRDHELNYDKYEAEVKSLYRRRVQIDKEIEETKSNWFKSGGKRDRDRLEELKCEADKAHRQLKQTLERREVIKSLHYFSENGDYKKGSRYYVSVSDVIIFKCLVKFETETNNETKKAEVDKIKGIMNRELRGFNASTDEFKDLYRGMIKLFNHEGEAPDFEGFLKCISTIKKMKKELAKLDSYREMMQDFGDNIRSTGDPFLYLDYYADEGRRIERIKNNRLSLAKDLDYIVHYLMNNNRYFLVLDCFRNPHTAKYFRDRYSKFYLFSLFSQPRVRLERLVAKESKRKNYSFDSVAFEETFCDYDTRDKGEHLSLTEKLYKQNVTETCLISDIAINNEETKEDLFLKLIRYIGLIADPGCTKPTSDEMFMNLAYTMAMKSNCISRQVGAVIEGEKGYVVGAGWNDVGEGQISCGLRNIRDLDLPAFEAYLNALDPEDSDKNAIITSLKEELGKSRFCFCFKDAMSANRIEKQIKKKIEGFFKLHERDFGEKTEKLYPELLETLRKDLKVKRLEYCKALHAEENAIIQGAKIGGMGIGGGTIYVTTFPCELCAKKIHQAGIDQVVYTEPYPGTVSKEIYLEGGVSKVSVRQFEGVKPFGYFKLFKPFHDQKEWQELNILGLVN